MRATAPASKRAAELGVDLASLANGHLVTVKMVEEACGNGAAAPPAKLPSPLEAPTGVERVAVIGAGLGAMQVLDILAPGTCSQTLLRRQQQAVALVDDDRSRWGGRIAGVPVVGGSEQLEELFANGRFDTAVISIGSSVSARTRFRELCENLGIPLTNAIDRTARICTDVQLGRGNVICAYCHFGVGTRIGDNNVLSAYNSFDHHNVLGTDITTGPGCMTSGLVHIGDRVRLGTGIYVEPHLEIGEGAQVASGAVIVNSVPPEHAVKRRVPTMATVPDSERSDPRLGAAHRHNEQMSIARISDTATTDSGGAWTPTAPSSARSGMRRAFVLVLIAIVLGLAGLYLVRAALVNVGGFRLGSASAVPHLADLALEWRFWAGGALIGIILLISLELYGSEELSKVVPLYSLSYVLIALIGQVFLGEDVTLQRWAGIVTIVTGVVVLLRS